MPCLGMATYSKLPPADAGCRSITCLIRDIFASLIPFGSRQSYWWRTPCIQLLRQIVPLTGVFPSSAVQVRPAVHPFYYIPLYRMS